MIMIVSLIAVTLNVMGQPTITSPTSGQVYYPRETMEIRWKSTRSNAWGIVTIVLKDVANNTTQFIAGTPNTGSFDWVVSKWNNATDFAIQVNDGGTTNSMTSVSIVIKDGKRPKPVSMTILKGVIIEWVSIPGYTYRVERSADSVLWEVIAESTVDFASAYITDYTSGPQALYRVLDNDSQSVDVKVSRGVSLEWTSIPGHTYRVNKSTNLINWEVMAEGKVDFADTYLDDYAESPQTFYQILDLTP